MATLQFNERKQLKVKLIAQSPLIHFQAKGHQAQSGVTLRASEVKPQFDKYIVRKIAGISPEKDLKPEDLSILKKKLNDQEQYKGIFEDLEKDDYALRYKMSIQMLPGEPIKKIILEKEGSKYSVYKPFFANTVISDDHKNERIRGVLGNPILTITCFCENLRKLIETNIENFFLSTNFGTRQGKGFGSFVLEGSEKNSTIVAKALKEKYGAPVCYVMRMSITPDRSDYYTKYFDCIGYFAGFMKSGMNLHGGYVKGYIFKYMLDKNIGNEKKWMKQEGISPIFPENDHRYLRNERNDITNYEYVRGVLGVPGDASYQSSHGRVKVTITNPVSKRDPNLDEEGKPILKRVPSPIFYKIIENNIYVVAGRVNPNLLNRVFRFSGQGMNSGELRTPAAFDIDDFMKKYVHYFNDTSNPNGPRRQFERDMRNVPTVVEVSE